ncbi:elongation factor Tu, partial [Striga asiatica]
MKVEEVHQSSKRARGDDDEIIAGNELCLQVEVKGPSVNDWVWIILSQGASWIWNSWSSVIPLLHNRVSIAIKNGAKTWLNELNWVPDLAGKKPVLSVNIEHRLFRVKDLIDGH